MQIMLSEYGYVSSALSSSTSYIYNPAYVAPEILKGDEEVDWKLCDVYAFGICLHEMCTRRNPYGDLGAFHVGWDVCKGKRPSIPKYVPSVLV